MKSQANLKTMPTKFLMNKKHNPDKCSMAKKTNKGHFICSKTGKDNQMLFLETEEA